VSYLSVQVLSARSLLSKLSFNNFLDNDNNVLQTRMILNAGNLVMAMVFVVSSIFGMNLSDDHQESYVLFTLVSTTWCSILTLDTTTVLDYGLKFH